MNKKFLGFIFAVIVMGVFSHVASAVDSAVSITGFDPSSAKVGNTIVINGKNFTNVKKVFFGAVDATGFSYIDSSTKISVVVPKGAVTDKITLVTDKESIDSPMVFTVDNNSTIILKINNVASNYVELMATGSLDADSYNFSIYDIQNSNLGEVLVDSKTSNIINSAKDRVITFYGLKPTNNYIAKLNVNGLTYSKRFSTPKAQLDFSTLNGMIREANDAYDKAVEGYAAGEYAQGSKARLSDAISNAEHVAGGVGINYIQSDINNAVRDLKTALNAFELSKIAPPAPSNTVEDPVITDIKSNGIVPKCNTGEIDKVTGQYKVPCDFTFFMKLINNAIKFLLFVIATPLIALILMYTGYLYLTAGGNSGQVEKVKHILLNAVVGYIIALAAWLIVSTIVSNIKLDPTINTFLTPMNQK